MSHQIDADTLASTNHRTIVAASNDKMLWAVVSGDYVGYEVHFKGRAVAIGLKLADAVAVYNAPPEPVA